MVELRGVSMMSCQRIALDDLVIGVRRSQHIGLQDHIVGAQRDFALASA